MNSINLKHLYYFWLTAREGSITKACDILGLTPQTLSSQISTLESNIELMLFKREGRSLVLTPTGKEVFTYADRIFEVTSQLEEMVKNSGKNRVIDFSVGIASTVHKILAWKVIRPATELSQKIHLVCRTAHASELLLDLKQKKVDVVITDYIPPDLEQEGLVVESMGSTSMSFFCKGGRARALDENFPQSLSNQNFISYGRNTPYLQKLRDWLRDHRLEVNIFAEIDDSALLKVIGESGAGIFSAPTYIQSEICNQYSVDVIGSVPEVREELYAIYRYSGAINPIVEALLRVKIDQ
ncbi:LysR substrate-binding domain-containing protein [uncultured Neptuniibacter sp.]|uniref:LysR substrate-binding domain-containing protein n=1 Tax=uncultured Neptuniibacter sp. TaxID=502143 RepID=UPI002625A094|nr:LysR substrate-binding domain-containing protein [uncultured Neptuniibacter sp.]